MSAEVEVVSEVKTRAFGVPAFDKKNLPEMIQGQVAKLDELNVRVEKAMKYAENAKSSADKAKRQSAGLFQKKAAIEELQSAGVHLAEAVQSGAEAQKISFEFQNKLAEITKYLFGLGVSNIASNRFVVRELELKLKGASQDKLSELARHEILLVVKQLKDQEDILKKQENFANAVKDHDAKLRENEKTARDLDKKIDALNLSIQGQLKDVYVEWNNQINDFKNSFYDALSSSEKSLEQRIVKAEERAKEFVRTTISELQAEIDKNLSAQLADVNGQLASSNEKILSVQDALKLAKVDSVKQHDQVAAAFVLVESRFSAQLDTVSGSMDIKLDAITKQFEAYQSNAKVKFRRLHIILGASTTLTVGLLVFIIFRM